MNQSLRPVLARVPRVPSNSSVLSNRSPCPPLGPRGPPRRRASASQLTATLLSNGENSIVERAGLASNAARKLGTARTYVGCRRWWPQHPPANADEQSSGVEEASCARLAAAASSAPNCGGIVCGSPMSRGPRRWVSAPNAIGRRPSSSPIAGRRTSAQIAGFAYAEHVRGPLRRSVPESGRWRSECRDRTRPLGRWSADEHNRATC
jgi:hypothetical protein